MANVVEIVVQGTDATNPGFKRALDNSKSLTREMRGMGAVINQAGNLAMAFGNSQLGAAINGLENTVVSAKRLSMELGNSKIAFAALASAAVVGGVTIGNSIRQYIPFFNEFDKLQRSTTAADKLQDIQLQSLALKNAEVAAAMRDRVTAMRQVRDIQGQSQLFGLVAKAPSKEETDLIEAIQKLQGERELKIEEEKERTIGEMIRRSKADILALESEHLGMMANENIRYQDTLRDIGRNQILEEEGRNTLIEDAFRIHQLKMAEIHMKGQDQIVAQEKLRKQNRLQVQQQYADGAATIAGNLAVVAAAFGEKGFAAFKAFRIAEAIASTYAGAARALADYPWPYSIAVAASVVAAGIANVAAISASKPGGQAHSGLDFVPSDSTFLLQQGERVVQRNQNERLENLLDDHEQGRSSGMGDVYLDMVKVGKVLWNASKDGRLEISARAIT